jgi:hypothetical protein
MRREAYILSPRRTINVMAKYELLSAKHLFLEMTFKIIISGVSGRIGTQVLEQALRHPSVSSIIALSRRPLPELARHEHVKVVILEDFNVYPESVIARLSGADGCIW